MANFGRRLPRSWTPKRFPRLVVLHARSTRELHQSFNFNKHTAMLFSKIKSGLVLDADQFANRGLDVLLQRAAQETTKAYPYPIQPVHWLSRDPEASDMRAYPKEYTWEWYGSEGVPQRTMRWGHAHPTWSHYALPWLAKWTSYVLAPNSTEAPAWLTRQGKIEDEDLMNVALWATSGATKQWCKYDIMQPDDFDMYMMQQEGNDTLFADSKYYPQGIPLVFLTAHAAKLPLISHWWLGRLWDQGSTTRKPIFHEGKWFSSAQELYAYDPALPCMI